MDIIKHYSEGIPYFAPKTAGQADSNLPDVKYAAADEYRKMLEELESRGKPTDPGAKLYNGSETRAHLSDTEIAVLANKYDVHDMDQETYDAFLDDLQSMGAVSEIEKRQMGYQGFQLIAYMDEDGNWVKCGSPSGVWSIPEGAIKNDECMFAPWGEETDISKWLADRTQNELVGVFDPSDWDQGRTYESLLKGVLKIVNRMEARQEEDAEAAEKAGLRRQIMDSESDFYTGMLNKMQAQVEKTRDDKEQQAIVDALGEVLDALSGKKDVTGEKASVNKTASDLTAKMGERIARLKQEDPEHPEAVKLEQMLKRLQELGIYFDLSDTDDIFTEEEDSFETLTQLLTRRQREEAISDTPQTERGEQQQ